MKTLSGVMRYRTNTLLMGLDDSVKDRTRTLTLLGADRDPTQLTAYGAGTAVRFAGTICAW